MKLSIIVCTYNRSRHLASVLESLSTQQTPEGFQWEVLVIDNNSRDDTQAVFEEFARRGKLQVRYVMETRQGLSHARNRGIAEASGEYLAFIDDDALADAHWVIELSNALDRYKCDCVGGKIYLKHVNPLPRWLTKELWGFLACLDYGDTPLKLPTQYIYGTNMAFTRRILNIVGEFNTELGRTGYLPIGGEETDLIDRIRAFHGEVYYVPSAIVNHVIDDYKLQKSYFYSLHFLEGKSNGKMLKGKIKGQLLGIPLYIFLQLFRNIGRCAYNPSVRKKMNIWWDLGFIRGCFDVYRRS